MVSLFAFDVLLGIDELASVGFSLIPLPPSSHSIFSLLLGICISLYLIRFLVY